MSTSAGSTARAGVLYLLGTALQGVALLVITPFLTSTLGASRYGEVAVGLVLVQMVYTVAVAGLPTVILREWHQDEQGPLVGRGLAGAMIGFGLALGVVGSLVAVVVALTTDIPLLRGVSLAWSGAGLTGVAAGQAVMRARQHPVGFFVLALASTAVAQLAGLLAARVDPTPEAFLAAYGVALVASAGLAVLLTHPIVRWGSVAARVRAGLRLALPMLPQAVAMIGLLTGDVYLVMGLLGSGATGSYQAALTTLGNMPFVLSTALFNAWGPSVYARPREARWPYAASTGTLLTAFVAVGGAGVALLSPWLVPILARDPSFDHLAMVRAVGPMAAVAVFYLLFQGASLAVVDAERTGWLLRAALSGLVTLGVVGSGLALAFAIPGMALGRLLAYVVLAVVAMWAGSRIGGLHWDARRLGPVLAFTLLVTVLAGGYLPSTGPGAVLRLVLAGLLALAGLAVAPRLLRLVRR